MHDAQGSLYTSDPTRENREGGKDIRQSSKHGLCALHEMKETFICLDGRLHGTYEGDF